MNLIHFSDEEIQEILDDLVSHPDQSLAPHLETCASCRQRFALYRQLYDRLAADPGFSLPPAFADSLLKKVIPAHRSFWARPFVRTAMLAGPFVLLLAGMLIFVDLKPLAGSFSRALHTLASSFSPLAGQFREILSRLNIGTSPILFAGMGLLGATLIDRLLRKQLSRRSH